MVHGQRQRSWVGTRRAWPVPNVIGKLRSEYVERTGDQPRHSVGMAAGAASTDDGTEVRKAVPGTALGGARKGVLKGRSQRVEPEDAGSTLGGALAGKPSRDPPGLGETARVR